MFLSQSDKEILDDFVPWQKHEGLFDTAHKIVIKLICSASILIQQVRQLNGITQRIDLIFSFPDPIIHLCQIALMPGPICCFIKGIGIRVDIDIKNCFLTNPLIIAASSSSSLAITK